MCASPAPRDRAYDAFASIYSRTMAEDFCRRALPVIESLLLRRLEPHARILDLCCGSGQMARALAERGFRITGLDASEPMLTHARQNSPGVDLILCDARQFTLSPVFDAAISTFNSLAHTRTLQELQCVFQNVRGCLRPGGSFLFDLTMEAAYSTKWCGWFGEVHETFAWTVRPSYDPRTRLACNDVTVFRRQSGKICDRSSVRITQKCYSEDEVRDQLLASGFTRMECYDAERDLSIAHEFGRCFFLAC